MSKRDLLLLHGALAVKGQFDALIPYLGETFTIHTLDFEGHGRTAAGKRAFRPDHFVENVLDYLDKNELGRIDIFGYSMGGFVGLRMARQEPLRVNRLFTLATKFRWTPEIAAKEAAFLDPDKLKEKIPRFAELLMSRHGVTEWESVLERTREMFRYLGSNGSLTPADLQAIPNTVRLSLGDRDTMVSIQETIDVYRCLPNGQLQIFPATQHPFEKVRPDMLAAAITSFFKA